MFKYLHFRASQGSQTCNLHLEVFCMSHHGLFRCHKLHTSHMAQHQRLVDTRTTRDVPTHAALGRHTQKPAALHIKDPEYKKLLWKKSITINGKNFRHSNLKYNYISQNIREFTLESTFFIFLPASGSSCGKTIE